MSSAASAACLITAWSLAGSASVRPWVLVKNGACLTLTTTRTAGRRSASTSRVTWSARRSTSSRTCAQSSMFCWKVVSRLRERGTQGSAETSVEPSPLAVCTSHGPIVGPNLAATTCRSAAASSEIV